MQVSRQPIKETTPRITDCKIKKLMLTSKYFYYVTGKIYHLKIGIYFVILCFKKFKEQGKI